MTIAELLKQSESLRDEAWEQQFLNQLPSLRFQVLEAQVQEGPDGWPYLFVEIHQGNEGGEDFFELQKWLLNQGVGLAINPLRSPPDYVLPYGQLWLYQTTGKFVAEVKPRLKGGEPFAIEDGQKIVAGPPTEEFFPTYARRVLKEFLNQQGVSQPLVLVVSSDQKNYDLCFSTESFGTPPAEEHVGILEAMSWFFPANYTLALVSEKGLPQFTPLA